MITGMFIVFFVLLIVFIVVSSVENYRDVDDEVIHTTVTTTTTINEPKTQVFDYEIVGELVRKKTKMSNQYYVIDPVDGDKVWLNDNDDMYEDGAGKIWRLK